MSRIRLLKNFREREKVVLSLTYTLLALILISSMVDVTGLNEDQNELLTRAGDPPFTVSGWTIPWEASSWSGMEEWADTLDSLSPFWYRTMQDGSIVRVFTPSHHEAYMDLCDENDIEVIPLVSNLHDPETVRNIVRNASIRTAHIDDLVRLTLENGYSGLEINYESLYTEDRDAFVDFIGNLTEAMHIYGKVLHVSVFPKTSGSDDRYGPAGYDYPGLGERADFIRLMAYNLHWSTCEVSGPVTSYEWMDQVVSYAASVIDPEKLILGIAQFGYDWPINNDGTTTGTAENHTYRSTRNLIREFDIERSWNVTSRTPYFVYRDRSGSLRAHHYTDSESLLHQMDIVRRHMIGGISIWRLGEDDPLSRSYVDLVRDGPVGDLPPFVRIGDDVQGMIGTAIRIGPAYIYDIDGHIASIDWDLMDGSHSNEIDPLHVYERGGYYNVSLKVTDDAGSVVMRTKTVRVAPFSSLSGTIQAMEGEPITFDGSGSWDIHGIVSYSWDFGDGTYLFHHTPIAEHTYLYPGIYKVTLTVINSLGFCDISEMQVVIKDDMPPVAIGGEDMIVWEDSIVYLDASKSHDNDLGLNYTWRVEERTLYGMYLRYVFEDPGFYPVHLTVTDRSGNRGFDVVNVTVRDRTAPVLMIEYENSIVLGEDIVLDASASCDNVGLDRILWHLDDDTLVIGESVLVIGEPRARRHYFTLELFDLEGNSNSTTVHVDVLDITPPTCSISYDPDPLPLNETYLAGTELLDRMSIPDDLIGCYLVNETIRFSACDINDDSGIFGISWSFGDGCRAEGESVYHSYGSVGVYKVVLTITDVWGNIMVQEISIVVLPTFETVIIEHRTYEDIQIIENVTVPYEENVTVEPEGKDWGWLPYAMSACVVVIVLIAIAETVTLIKRRRRNDKAVMEEGVANER
ncbi:MAG: PKD domain-containing protein [Candidatus Thermoplasmatota archaeon]|nr:PKD domain-containing protein [Candidatus Thermoplasmatota archaeon]